MHAEYSSRLNRFRHIKTSRAGCNAQRRECKSPWREVVESVKAKPHKEKNWQEKISFLSAPGTRWSVQLFHTSPSAGRWVTGGGMRREQSLAERGARRASRLKTSRGPSQPPRWLPRILKSSPPPASYTKSSDPRFFPSCASHRPPSHPARPSKATTTLETHLYIFFFFSVLRIVSGYSFLCIAPTLAVIFFFSVREARHRLCRLRLSHPRVETGPTVTTASNSDNGIFATTTGTRHNIRRVAGAGTSCPITSTGVSCIVYSVDLGVFWMAPSIRGMDSAMSSF